MLDEQWYGKQKTQLVVQRVGKEMPWSMARMQAYKPHAAKMPRLEGMTSSLPHRPNAPAVAK
jgi:hypothetical protein